MIPFSKTAAVGYKGDRPFQTLLFLYRHEWGNIGLSFLFYLIKHSPEWIRPIVIAHVIDVISNPEAHSLSDLWIDAAILAFTVVQNLPTNYLHVRFMSAATRQMEYNLRSTIAQQLQQLSVGFYHHNSKGRLQNKILRDVEAIQALTVHLFQLLPSAVITILVALVATAIRAPGFLIFFVGTVPIAAGLVRSLRKPIRDRNRAFRGRLEQMSGRIIEMVQLIPVTRAHGAEDTALQRIDTELSSVSHAAGRLDRINAIAGASSWVTLRLFNSICLIISATFAYTGRFNISVGDVVLLTGYFDSLTQAVVRIMSVLPQIGKGFEAIRSVGEILECPDIEQNEGKQAVRQVRGEFVFDRVSFFYPEDDSHAIRDFSLHVTPGETIAIVGPSGAGKSTLLNLIIGFLRPTAGQILLDGRDTEELDLRTYRQFLSVVSQETILFEGTVRDNITYGCDRASESQIWQALDDANATDFIKHLPHGLDSRIGEDGMKLSGGQRQRIAIARALIRDPKVLVLDEATASLDTATEIQIQEALERLMQNRTTFLVAHRLSTTRSADRIVVVDGGRTVEIGDRQQLLERQGLYAQLYELQT
jgi:ATP-binding cassette subfamily B protein